MEVEKDLWSWLRRPSVKKRDEAGNTPKAKDAAGAVENQPNTFSLDGSPNVLKFATGSISDFDRRPPPPCNPDEYATRTPRAGSSSTSPPPLPPPRLPIPMLSRAPSTESRSLEPPVTKATLSELDINKIMTASQPRPTAVAGRGLDRVERVTDQLEKPSLDDRTYRVIRLPNQLEVLLVHDPETDKASAAIHNHLRPDINFDPELYFRPNLDGERGRKKQEKANQSQKASGDQIPSSRDKSGVATNHSLRISQRQLHAAQVDTRRTSDSTDNTPELMIKQPETRPISQEQLVAEVKGIYAGLVMVETKCIEVDNALNSENAQDDSAERLSNEQWQALIALHRTLLHEHHDFFLASQHPSASPALRRLASKYAMPARMWRHGIHSFLELLRRKLPASLEHMLSFIYLAYSMIALLYETMPAFEDTWIECLGDLGRYRMAIEDDDLRDREVWTAVSRAWYTKASDRSPTTGRLYHHLAILARPSSLQQLFYYTKSLCVAMRHVSDKEDVLFDQPSEMMRFVSTYRAFTKTYGIMLPRNSPGTLEIFMDDFIGSLEDHIGRSTRRWLDSGYHLSILLQNEQLLPLSVDNHKQVLIPVGLPAWSEDPTVFETHKPSLTFSLPRNSDWVTKITRVIKPLALVKLLRIYLSFVLVSLVIADPASAANRHRTPKLLLLGGSAISSLGTGMTSLQLELADDPHGTKLLKMSLRIACSTSLGILAVGYPLWFLPYAQKTQRFLSGLCGVGLFLWVFLRRDPASAAVETGDAFAWLDDLNLFGLIAVVAGILNAESSLMAAAFAHGETDSVAADDGDQVNDNGRRRRADEESQDDNRTDGRRHRTDDESRGDTRNGNGGFGLAAISSVAQAMAGA